VTTGAGTVGRMADSANGKAAKTAPARDQRGRERLPIKMLNDRILVDMDRQEGERRSTGGILIPATAQVGKRLAWAEVIAVGPNVRAMELGDHVLFNPEDRYEVEVGGDDYLILRERDIHAVAATRLEESSAGLYL
jgi:chaperonin GroES